MKNAQTLCKEIYDTAIERAKLELQLKQLNKRLNGLKGEANQAMFEENVEAITIEGITFKPDQEANFSLNDGSKTWVESQRFRAWLEENNLQDVVKTREEIHHGTRNKILKEALEPGSKTTKPDMVNVSYFATVKFSEAAIERKVAPASEA